LTNEHKGGVLMPDYSTKHGMSNTRLYKIWSNMKARCENPNNDKFYNYGGRGIQVCLAWRDFMVFYNWAMVNGYDDTLTIDRKNNDGNYEPENCRWITLAEQQTNKRKRPKSVRLNWRHKSKKGESTL
jgi:hypothetical protein